MKKLDDLKSAGEDIDAAIAVGCVANAVDQSEIILTSSFGADSVVMLHLVSSAIPGVRVLVIDTGYFFPETYEFIEEMRKVFQINVIFRQSEISPARMEALVGQLWEHGPQGIQRYNDLRKRLPMEAALGELKPKVWLTGRRKSQTEARAGLEIIERREDGICKINPILHWTDEVVERYIHANNLPRHPLVAQGYSSIGDWHSTRPGKGREGRNLGEGSECRLHGYGQQRNR